MRVFIRSLGSVLMLLVAGCAAITEPLGVEDPFAIPRAFEGMPRNEAILVPSLGLASVVVEAPRGLEASFGPDIQSRVIRALDAKDIATPTMSTAGAWTLRGRFAGTYVSDKRGPRVGVIVWRLITPDGEMREQFTTTFTGDNADNLVPRLADQATSVADRVMAVLAKAGSATGPVASGVVAEEPLKVRVGRITGAPGDGNRALALALEGALRGKGARIEKVRNAKAWRVDCAVSVSRLSPTEDRVRLVWSLVDADGKQAGTLVQENPVPRGQLARKWGSTAAYAAEAAADGMWQVLQQIRAGGGS